MNRLLVALLLALLPVESVHAAAEMPLPLVPTLLLALIGLLLVTAVGLWSRLQQLQRECRTLTAQLVEAESVSARAEASANQMQSEFIANINHEIRTPMNAIIGYTEMLANSQLGFKEQRFAAIIHKSSTALVSIFNDIMELSKIDTGRLQIVPASVRLSQVIRETERLHKEHADEKGLRLICSIADHLPPFFLLDGHRLQQILQNLVSNAIKFTREGSISLLVDGAASARLPGSVDLTFLVEDTGIGIDAIDQGKIMELFRQGHDVSAGHYGRVGLGLTLCARLAAMMGGRIDLHSVEGQGSRFTLVLEGIAVSVSYPADAAGQGRGVTPMQPATLLVVDDVDLVKDVFLDYFRDSHFRVLTASRGQEALAIATNERPDIIFMDLNLSGKNGRQVTEQLRQQPDTKGIPVVVMTGEMLEESEVKPLFDDFLQKPFRINTLKEMLERHIRPGVAGGGSMLSSVETSEQGLIAGLSSLWSKELETLRCQALRSGSLTDAALLGHAMRRLAGSGERNLLAEMGEQLLRHANEPDILGVDRILTQLTRLTSCTHP